MHIISENSELSMFPPFQDTVKRSLALFSSWFYSSRSFKISSKEDRDWNRENGAVKKRVPQDSSVNPSFKYHAVFFNFNCSCIANFFFSYNLCLTKRISQKGTGEKKTCLFSWLYVPRAKQLSSLNIYSLKREGKKERLT